MKHQPVIKSLYRSLLRTSRNYEPYNRDIIQEHVRIVSKDKNIGLDRTFLINMGFRYLRLLNNDDKKVYQIHKNSNSFYDIFTNLENAPPKELWINLCMETELSRQYVVEWESTVKYILQDEENAYYMDDINELDNEIEQLDIYQNKSFSKYKDLVNEYMLNMKKVRKHRGIIQTGKNAGKLKNGYKYTGKILKNGKKEIRKRRF